MKNVLIMLCAVLVFTACKSNKAPEEGKQAASAQESSSGSSDLGKGRFELKSGILVSEAEMLGKGNAEMKMTFDDYGKTALTEMTMKVMGTEMVSRSLLKDGYVYTWTIPSTGMAMKMKIENDKFNEKNIDYRNLTDEIRKKYNIKEEADETIDGKTCKVFSFSPGNGMVGKSYNWKGIPIQSEVTVKGGKIVSKFKSLDENPNLPASIFDLPAGVEFKDFNASAPTAAH